MNADRTITQEGNDERNDHRSNTTPGDVTGPHFGRDEQGRFDHRYWRCEDCGFESIDPRLRRGCFRCAGVDPDAGLAPGRSRSADAE
jgi:hypothetical protein